MEEFIEIIEEPEEVVEINENVLNEVDPTVPSWVKEITQKDIDRWNEGGTGGTTLTAGENINITDDGVISVLTAPNVEKDNTKPITSAAVYTEVGNINVLLQTI